MRGEYPVPSHDLAEGLGVSERTLRADISHVNRDIEALGCHVRNVRGKGYALVAEDDAARERLRRELAGSKPLGLETVQDRVRALLLALLLCSGHISAPSLADKVFISQTTLMSYIKDIRRVLAEHGLSLENKSNIGYRVTGRESAIRSLALNLLLSEKEGEERASALARSGLLGEDILARIEGSLSAFAKESDVRFSDIGFQTSALYIAVAGIRVSQGAEIETRSIALGTGTETLSRLFEDLQQKLAVVFGQNERVRIATYISAGSNLPMNLTVFREYALDYTRQILEYIASTYRFDLRGDEILVNNLAHHLQAALEANYFSVSVPNTLLDVIRSTYMLPYEMAATAVHVVLEHEPFSLTDGDVGYVAMHLVVALDRASKRYEHLHPTKAAVFYKGNFAEGNFVSAKLLLEFGEQIDVRYVLPSNAAGEEGLENVEIAVSTTPIKQELPFPVVVIDVAHPASAMNHIRSMLEGGTGSKPFEGFFDERLFAHLDVSGKDEAIRSLCALMRQALPLDSAFEQSVFERERRIPTALDGVLAIPHPLSFNLSESKIAVGILDAPIPWSNERDAQIVMLLGLSRDSKELPALYDVLADVANNRELERELLRAQSLGEFVETLAKASGRE